MCIDMCIHICTDMCIDMGTDNVNSESLEMCHRHVCIDMDLY